MKNSIKNVIIISIIVISIILIVYAIIIKSKDENTEIFLNEEAALVKNEEESSSSDKKEIIVHITGQVMKPGIVKLKENSRIADAIIEAGGTTEEANLEQINLAYKLEDGVKIYVPSIYDKKDEISIIQTDAGEKVIDKTNEMIKETKKININIATQMELESLPGVGSSTAQKIIAYRQEKGKFKKIDDLKEVSGIGENKFKIIKEFICI